MGILLSNNTWMEKVNPLNFFYIFLLDVNFKNLTVKLHVLKKLCTKNKFIDWIVYNIQFKQNLICILKT